MVTVVVVTVVSLHYVTEGLLNVWVISEIIGVSNLEVHSLADFLIRVSGQSECILVLNVKGRTIDGNSLRLPNSSLVEIFMAFA